MSEIYWQRFEKECGKRDGELFEDLVKYLLEAEFGCQWTRTGKSHDDNRDFYLYSAEERVWVECKNYKPNLSMSVIAPTLVMAQIHDVHKVLFFSSSPFNKQAIKKLFLFAEKTGKTVQIFDGEVILDLIRKHHESLPPRFRINDGNPLRFPSPLCDFMYIQDPIAGVALEDRLIHPLRNVREIQFNTTFEIAILVQNPSTREAAEVSVYLLPPNPDTTERPDIFHFELIESDIAEFRRVETLPPGGGIFMRFYFKQRRFKERIDLPRFVVEVRAGDDAPTQFVSDSVTVKCEWIGETFLVGSAYQAILEQLEEKSLGREKLGIVTLVGSSGTGKTRLLRESIDRLLRRKYRIISFVGDERFDAISILQEIVFFLYEIPRSDILVEMERYARDAAVSEGDNEVHTAVSLIRHFKNAKSGPEFKEAIDKFGAIIFEKLSARPIAILIDNVQFFSQEFLHFLNKYIAFSLNQPRPNRSVLLLAFNTDYLDANSSSLLKWINDLQAHQQLHITCFPVKGFEDAGQCVIYLRELIRLQSPRADALLTFLADRVSYKPFHLMQSLKYLHDEGALTHSSDGTGYLAPTDLLEKSINGLPAGLDAVLERRWQYLSDEASKDGYDCDLQVVMACVALFGELDDYLTGVLQLNDHAVEALLRRSFLRREMSRQRGRIILFEHGLIENFVFGKKPELLSLAIDHLMAGHHVESIPNYALAHTLCRMRQHPTPAEVMTILAVLPTLTVSRTLQGFFLMQWFAFVVDNAKALGSGTAVCRSFYDVCTRANDFLGVAKSQVFYARALEFLTENESDNLREKTGIYRKFINSYSDILHHNGEVERAIDLLDSKYRKYRDLLEEVGDTVDRDHILASLSLMCNRLHINYKTIHTREAQQKMWETLAESSQYAAMIEDGTLRDELEYINLSDEGYCYYGYRWERDRLFEKWAKWKDYRDRVPAKTLNFYRKNVQLLLIEQQSERALETIAEGEEYLRTGEFSYERLAFQTFFTHARLVAMLQRERERFEAELYRTLTEGIAGELLAPSGSDYKMHQMSGIFAFYRQDKKGAYNGFRRGYIELQRNVHQTRHRDKLKLISDNLLYATVALGIVPNGEEIDFDFWRQSEEYGIWARLCKSAPSERSVFLAERRAIGILQTADGLMNFPLI